MPLYEAIVTRARELNLAGATVLRGVLGYGASSRIHSAKLLDLAVDLPVVIEIVDTEERLALLMPFIDAHVTEGLVTRRRCAWWDTGTGQAKRCNNTPDLSFL